MKSKSVIIKISVVLVVCIAAYSPVKNWLWENEVEIDIMLALAKSELGLNSEEDESEFSGTHKPWYGERPAESEPKILVERDESIKPFREIGSRLGEYALRQEGEASVTIGANIFDANGDGLLDLYIPSDQRPSAMASDENKVLTLEKVPAKPSTLYINQGNDENGDPFYKTMQELVQEKGGQYIKDELLIEGKYVPRTSLKDDAYSVGRVARGSVAADFNGDGLIDLYVLNGHYGVPFQTADLGVPMYPAGKNLGRDASEKPLLLRIARFLRSDTLEDGMDIVVNYSGKSEREGRNTLYLNMGDKDANGIPEWKDVTNESGVGGRWASASAAVSDYDRDGDLDIYVANFQDPDFLGFGAMRFSGQQNQLYKNMLAETGQFKYENVALELKVAGLHDEENLSSTQYVSHLDAEVEISEMFHDGEKVGEKADHSWSALFYDFNSDGWDDLVVANDMGNRLRVYKNLQGKGFEYQKKFDDIAWEGCWMGLSRGDLSGNGVDELLATNCGSQVLSIQNTRLLFQEGSPKERSVMANEVISYVKGINTLHHEVLSFSETEGLTSTAKDIEVEHSKTLPPDQTLTQNILPKFSNIFEENNYANSLSGIEFAFSAPMFDVDNDSDLDIYFVGALGRGNDGHFGDFSGSPGRLLLNKTKDEKIAFEDKTVDYQLLDITGVDYDHNPPRRKSPGTGWIKRDYIYISDTSSYAGMGLDASGSKTRDLSRMHEHGSTVLPADLNNDGNMDLVVTHLGGYTSNSPDAGNLKVSILGRIMAVPGITKLARPLTDYEYGKTSMYINSGVPKGKVGNWVKVALKDDSGFNQFAVGAKVTVNDKYLRHMEATSGMVGGAVHQSVHVGLGADKLNSLSIVWPSGSHEPVSYTFSGVANQQVCIDKAQGVVVCESLSNDNMNKLVMK